MADTPNEGDGFPGLFDSRSDFPLQLHFELDDLGLTLGAFRVYAHLVRRAGRDGRVFPSYRSIGEKCFRPDYPNAQPETLDRKAKAAMKELRAFGVVMVQHTSREDGGQGTNNYHLTPRVQWHGGGVNTRGGVPVHPGGVTAPKVNQEQVNQGSKEKDGAENRRADSRQLIPADDPGNSMPPVGDSRSRTGKVGSSGKAEGIEKVSRGAAATVEIPAALLQHPGFEDAWGEWLTYRRSRRLSCLPQTLRGQLAMLAGQSEPCAVIGQTITNGWNGLFPLKGSTGAPRKPQTVLEANQRLVGRIQDTAEAVRGVFDD